MKNHLMVPLGEADPDEYCEILDVAIRELFLLLFERRELDLHEAQTQAIHALTDFQSKLKSSQPCTIPTTFPKSTSAN